MTSEMLLCVHCRRLSPRTTFAGYRGTDDTVAQCNACGEGGLVDPGEMGTAAMLQTMDDEERLARAPFATRALSRAAIAGGLAVGTGVVAMMLIALFFGTGRGHQVSWLLALIAGGVIAIPMGLLGLRAVGRRWARTRALPRPARWALSLPEGRSTLDDDGALGCEEPLVSPLSGRTCAAYEIGVRYDGDAGGPLGSWLLLEQSCAAVSVGETQLPGESVYLEWPRRIFEGETGDPRLRHFLELRGLTSAHEALHIFETLVPHGTPVALARAGNGIAVMRPRSTSRRLG